MTPSAIVSLVRAELEKLDHDCGACDQTSAWFKARRSLIEKMGQRIANVTGAKVRERWDGSNVRIGGFAASSTSGLDNALRNWLRAAEKRGFGA